MQYNKLRKQYNVFGLLAGSPSMIKALYKALLQQNIAPSVGTGRALSATQKRKFPVFPSFPAFPSFPRFPTVPSLPQ